MTGLCPVCLDCFCAEVSFGVLSTDFELFRSRGDTLVLDFLCLFNSGPALAEEVEVVAAVADLDRFGAGKIGVLAYLGDTDTNGDGVCRECVIGAGFGNIFTFAFSEYFMVGR